MDDNENIALCPNADCRSKTEDMPHDISYMKCDLANLKHILKCKTCNTTWTMPIKIDGNGMCEI
tara:strand:- start:110 stop:301 length:192 start_codon:yes stop_codon:yes gene_type:complete